MLGIILIAAALGTGQAADPSPTDVVSLKLRPQALVWGEQVTFDDVLLFQPARSSLRQAVGGQSLSVPEGGASTVAVTHEQIERRLRELGVDLGGVLLGGAMSCQVTLRPPQPAEVILAPAALEAENGVLAGAGTLAEALRRHVTDELSGLGGTPELEFEQAARQFLDLTSPPFEFSIRGQGAARLGLREYRVILRRDGRTVRAVSVFVRVRLSKEVVVARRPLNVGSFVRREEIALEARLFEREEDIGPDRLEQVVGQQVAQFVPADQMVARGDLKAVELVQRSRPVKVLSSGRNVQVHLTGTALDNGNYGDAVRVRLGDARRSRTILRGIVTGVGTVQVMEEG
ncbi:MAG: flagellar basal body P-ring formation chaperone FlgA [Phycisphaerae bacterium]